VVSNKNTDGIRYLFPSLTQRLHQYEYSFTGNLFIGFKEAIGYRESENKYKKSILGYLGKYQFGNETLKSVEYTILLYFLES
jgi:hypothetical protein